MLMLVANVFTFYKRSRCCSFGRQTITDWVTDQIKYRTMMLLLTGIKVEWESTCGWLIAQRIRVWGQHASVSLHLNHKSVKIQWFWLCDFWTLWCTLISVTTRADSLVIMFKMKSKTCESFKSLFSLLSTIVKETLY